MRILRLTLAVMVPPIAGCNIIGPEQSFRQWRALTPSPCVGNRMDALHVDDDGTLWTGCGTTTEGFGLFRSVDAGTSWALVDPPNARGFFADYRVNTISRSADDRLYVGGTGGDAMVVTLDDADNVAVVLEVGDQAGTSFPVGHFRRDSTGRAVAESLTGTDVLTREGDLADFVATGIFAAGVSHQILDLTLAGDTFHAVGSTIGEPNVYFRETTRAGQPVAFDVLELSGGALGFSGELRAVAALGDTVIAGGVDEDADQAVLHTINGDDVTTTRVQDVIPELDRSTVRGACANSASFFVVGEETVTNGRAFVLRSDDGGTSWTDLSADLPTDATTLTRCVMTRDGLTVAGGGGAVLDGPSF